MIEKVTLFLLGFVCGCAIVFSIMWPSLIFYYKKFGEARLLLWRDDATVEEDRYEFVENTRQYI